MDFANAIIEMLGLQGVDIEKISVAKSARKITIAVRQKRDDCFCTRCGLQFDGVKEWCLKHLKAPPLGIYSNVEISFYQMRGVCTDCQRTEMAKAAFVHTEFASMTCGYAEVAGRLMEEITCEAVARLLHTDGMTMWRLDQWRMAYMEKRMRLPDNLDVTQLCADEVHFRSVENKKRGTFQRKTKPEFVTNLISPKAGKVISNALGRDSVALEETLLKLTPEQLDTVEHFSVDMHDPFIAVIKTECSNAEIAIDRFHLVQKANEAFDKVRRSEFRLAREQKDNFQTEMLEPHRRFILVSREKDLTRYECCCLHRGRDADMDIPTAILFLD